MILMESVVDYQGLTPDVLVRKRPSEQQTLANAVIDSQAAFGHEAESDFSFLPSEQQTLANAVIDSQAAFGHEAESDFSFLQLLSSGDATQTHAVTSKDGKECILPSGMKMRSGTTKEDL